MVKVKRKIKKTKKSFAIHHWCGLVAGAFLLVISFTGAILVFDDDIDQALFASHKKLTDPAAYISYDQSFERIRSAYPGWEIRVPEVPSSLHENILYELRQGKVRKWIFAHPATGEIHSQVDRADRRFTHVLLNIHYNLLSGTAGKIIVLLVGVIFLVSLITGIMVYRKSIAKVLMLRQKVSFRSRRAMYSSLHRILGVWGLLFNFLMAISGVFLGYLVVKSALQNKDMLIEVPALTYAIDDAIANAERAYPGFEVTYLRFPKNAEGNLQLLGRFTDDPLYYGKYYSSIVINAEGMAEEGVFLKDRPWYMRMLKVLQPIHFGDYAGWLVKIIYCLGAMLPPLLSVTGFLLWKARSTSKPVSPGKAARLFSGASVAYRSLKK